MAVNFIFDEKSLRRFSKVQKKLAKRTKYVSAQLLNNMAFAGRDKTLKFLPRHMVVRSKPFASRQTKVEKTRGSIALAAQAAIYGSAAAQNFTGWKEQQFGGKKDRTTALGGRVGKAKTRRMTSKAKLKSSKRFRSPRREYIANAKSPKHKAQAFLAIFNRERQKIPFMLTDHPTLPSGLYVLRGGRRLTTLQRFEPKQVRRSRWMENVNRRVVKRFPAEREWGRLWRDQLRRFK